MPLEVIANSSTFLQDKSGYKNTQTQVNSEIIISPDINHGNLDINNAIRINNEITNYQNRNSEIVNKDDNDKKFGNTKNNQNNSNIDNQLNRGLDISKTNILNIQMTKEKQVIKGCFYHL